MRILLFVLFEIFCQEFLWDFFNDFVVLIWNLFPVVLSPNFWHQRIYDTLGSRAIGTWRFLWQAAAAWARAGIGCSSSWISASRQSRKSSNETRQRVVHWTVSTWINSHATLIITIHCRILPETDVSPKVLWNPTLTTFFGVGVVPVRKTPCMKKQIC